MPFRMTAPRHEFSPGLRQHAALISALGFVTDDVVLSSADAFAGLKVSGQAIASASNLLLSTRLAQ